MHPAFRVFASAAAVTLITACGNKEPEQAAAPNDSHVAKSVQAFLDVTCTYAPSQNAVVSHAASIAGGGAATATAIAKAAGLSAVAHSSGAYIFTGPSGYLAGTLGTAITEPVVVGVGIFVAGVAATVELICAPTNHPEMVARVMAASGEFLARAKSSIEATSTAATPIVAEVQSRVIKTGNDAIEYASRKSVEVSAAYRKVTIE